LGLSQSRGPKLFGREIIFEEFQPMCCWYLNVTVRQTDGRTDKRLTVALPRSALASRGKKRSGLERMSQIVYLFNADRANPFAAKVKCNSVIVI